MEDAGPGDPKDSNAFSPEEGEETAIAETTMATVSLALNEGEMQSSEAPPAPNDKDKEPEEEGVETAIAENTKTTVSLALNEGETQSSEAPPAPNEFDRESLDAEMKDADEPKDNNTTETTNKEHTVVEDANVTVEENKETEVVPAVKEDDNKVTEEEAPHLPDSTQAEEVKPAEESLPDDSTQAEVNNSIRLLNTGDTPRRSSRLSEKSKATESPEMEDAGPGDPKDSNTVSPEESVEIAIAETTTATVSLALNEGEMQSSEAPPAPNEFDRESLDAEMKDADEPKDSIITETTNKEHTVVEDANVTVEENKETEVVPAVKEDDNKVTEEETSKTVEENHPVKEAALPDSTQAEEVKPAEESLPDNSTQAEVNNSIRVSPGEESFADNSVQPEDGELQRNITSPGQQLVGLNRQMNQGYQPMNQSDPDTWSENTGRANSIRVSPAEESFADNSVQPEEGELQRNITSPGQQLVGLNRHMNQGYQPMNQSDPDTLSENTGRAITGGRAINAEHNFENAIHMWMAIICCPINLIGFMIAVGWVGTGTHQQFEKSPLTLHSEIFPRIDGFFYMSSAPPCTGNFYSYSLLSY